MGGQRRTDESHDVRQKAKDDQDHDQARDEDQDTSYGARNVQQRAWSKYAEMQGPDGDFKGQGDQTKISAEFNAAVTAKQGAKLVSLVEKMSRETRDTVVSQLATLAPLLPGNDVLRIADLVKADLGTSLDAALAAKPPPSLHQMRAYLADIHPQELWFALYTDTRLAALRKLYPGPATDLVAQITDRAGWQSPVLIRWYVETLPAKTVAREMMTAKDHTELLQRMETLDAVGASAWEWVRALDDTMVISASAETMQDLIRGAPADLKDILTSKEAVRAAAKPKQVEKNIREDKRELTAHGSVDDIASATQTAGMSMDEQVAWLLQKPGVSLAEVRQAAVAWTTETAFTPKGLQQLHDRFPDTTPADVFGFIPDALYRLSVKHVWLRRWLVNKAEPIEVLRFVTFDPNHIAELWNWCVANGLDEKAWLYKIGGGRDDHLLRRFVLGCPDLNVANYVKVHMIADHVKPGGTEVVAAPIDDRAYQSKRDTLEDDLGNKANAKQLSKDITGLTDEQVVELRQDTVKLKQLLESSSADQVMRIIDRVQPKLRDVLNFAPSGKVKGIAEWMSGRPGDQVIEALGQTKGPDHARALAPGAGPLRLFPPLEDGTVLAQVLLRNPDVSSWVLTDSEPLAALAVLGSPAAATTAIKGLAQYPGNIEALPPGKMLPPKAHDGMVRLAGLATGDLKEALNEKLREKPVAVDDSEAPQDNAQLVKDSTAKGKTLTSSIEEAFKVDVSAETLLTLCRDHLDGVAELMKHPKLVTRLRGVVGMSPKFVFPGHLAEVLTSAEGRAWAFEECAPHDILRACGDPKVAAGVAAAVDANDDAAVMWVWALPRGKGLGENEKRTIKTLALQCTQDVAKRRLFAARFDIDTVATGFSGKEIDRMWTVLERVPESHISDGSVSTLTEFPSGGKGAGVYEDHRISLSDSLTESRGLPTYDREGATVGMSKEEAKQSLGLDDVMFEEWVKAEKIRLWEGKYYLRYRPESDALTATLLHEVGHAVDHMLGNHSDLVFKLAGWQAHTEAEFDQWAGDLGGWSGVKADDQKQIREVWMMWLSSSRGDQAKESVGDMVASDHPAVSKDYASVGVVEVARKKQIASRRDPAIVNGKAAFVNHSQQRWYTMNKQGLQSAPSDYSLTAPGEYFAECYMMYYRDYDGTAKTADKKGERLAPWIKQWFDKNVDNVGHNPSATTKKA